MKKIIYLIGTLFSAFILTIIFNFSSFFSNFKETVYYYIGNTYYKKGDFTGSILEYNKITLSGGILEFDKLHNLGNIYYRQGEKQKNDDLKILYWGKSLSSYKKALDIKTNVNKDETQKNYTFVLEKLKKLIQPKEDNKNGTGSQKSGTGTESGKAWTNSSQGFKSFGNSSFSGLTENEKQELQKYSQDLKNFQKENNRFLQKGVSTGTDFDDMVNRYFKGDPNFDDTLPDNTNLEKDW